MKKYFKGLFAILFILTLLPLVIYMTYKYTEEAEVTETIQEESSISEVIESEPEIVSESVPEPFAIPGYEPLPENKPEIESEPMPDYVMGGFVAIDKENDDGFKEALHYMTHQKVYAETKFGAIEMTEENIEEMFSILDQAKYEDESYYREVLTAWKNGDFSNSLDVHNRIYREQDGDTGFATRLLTPEEEQEFIENNFR